jgi:endonuclease/exonuclease/phosphatase family metal-dependent hydrolase
MRLISWNILRRIGATAEDLAALIDARSPDLLLLQEATTDIDALPTLAGGHFWRRSMLHRIHGLGIWSPTPFPDPHVLDLPSNSDSRTQDRRFAAILRLAGVSIVNVHLSHGQALLRRQLRYVATNVTGPAVIIGDMNVVGPVRLPGFSDVGPRGTTHLAKGILPFRLDRCLTRGLVSTGSAILDRGRSDHWPILVELDRPHRQR